MSTLIVPLNVGSVITVTGANAIANLAYANVADKMVIDRASNLGLLVDFTLDLTFATAPVKG
ncbi:MAG: hypothetical protein ACXWT0_01545, partial [Methylobacter sp.]